MAKPSSKAKGNPADPASGARKKIAPPKGTRDAYPADVLRRRYITQAWRDASIRCGFEEIEGPTFEMAELYAVKSGDGILNELFQAFSGKNPAELEQVQQEGKAPYALRPEFTPTLARMYAARAKQLPQPCKWFTAGPYFRAEKPQRGRLREFLQWNCDVIGAPNDSDEAKAEMDAEVIGSLFSFCQSVGLVQEFAHSYDFKIRFNHREVAKRVLQTCGVPDEKLERAYAVLDRLQMFTQQQVKHESEGIGLDLGEFDAIVCTASEVFNQGAMGVDICNLDTIKSSLEEIQASEAVYEQGFKKAGFGGLVPFLECVFDSGAYDLLCLDPMIVRGLAYYTGTVFEVIADGERAVAGGGRYDNLIELFGGPPTPACGFGMGDVVLSNLLDDKGLFPEGAELMEAVSRAPASVRPEAFVIHNGSDESRALVRPLVAALRRGVEAEGFDGKPWSAERYRSNDGGGGIGGGISGGVRPMHARQSYKATGNMGKLKADGVKQHARFIVEVHEPDKVELRDLDRGESLTSSKGSWSVDPASDVYVGRGLAQVMNG